jgi:hypothetical protein
MALDLLYSWILAQLEHCRRGLLTDDVAASFLQFLMSPDDAADSRRSIIKRPPLVTSISAPLPEQRLCSPTKKAIQSPFQYCKSSSTNASMLLLSLNTNALPLPLSHPCRPRGGGFQIA